MLTRLQFGQMKNKQQRVNSGFWHTKEVVRPSVTKPLPLHCVQACRGGTCPSVTKPLPLHSGRNLEGSTWYTRETYRKDKEHTKIKIIAMFRT